MNQRVETMARAVRQIGLPEKGLSLNQAETQASAIPPDPQPPQKITDWVDPGGFLRLRGGRLPA